MDLTFDALTRVDLAGQVGIYWVRIYVDQTEAVVVIADVPANPGPSPTNAFSRIAAEILQSHSFDGCSIRWVIWYPAGRLGDVSSFSEASLSPEGTAGWVSQDVARVTIEKIIQAALTPLPPHEETLRQVLALGGRLDPAADRIRWTVVPKASRPPPEYPFRCPLRERYRDFVRAEMVADESLSRSAAVDRFFDQLGSELLECPMHVGDWEAVARASVRVVQSVGADAGVSTVLEELASYTLAPVERRWTESLFVDPMFWDETSYGNGQHRGCALRLTTAPTVVKPEFVPGIDPAGTWTLLGE